jgi:hypothetical protein
MAQAGKPFALARWFGQLTPLRTRGPIKTWFVGQAGRVRPRWFCSELVMECCAAAGIVDPAVARPSATYPSDLFFGRSFNLYLNFHLDEILCGWRPPARWVPEPATANGEWIHGPAHPSAQSIGP